MVAIHCKIVCVCVCARKFSHARTNERTDFGFLSIFARTNIDNSKLVRCHLYIKFQASRKLNFSRKSWDYERFGPFIIGIKSCKIKRRVGEKVRNYNTKTHTFGSNMCKLLSIVMKLRGFGIMVFFCVMKLWIVLLW